MSYIKTTNRVYIKKHECNIKQVQCPYCKVFLQDVPDYITAMYCWKCKKEFRIQQDASKLISSEPPKNKRTIIALVQR